MSTVIMRIWHSKKQSFIQGRLCEKEKIEKWCELMKGADNRFTIMVDDSDESEISLTIVIPGSTQKERSELAALVKSKLSVKGNPT